ncbi:ATP-binding protein [Tardiphaga sp. 709]|uniref:ATP-binding protein n=1 Tax=Tardiphaga sp. 709 TaxID=3076039 RepID=UPI0028E629CC|nr:ATP-binding protein [Tardiphaga sp. 709]WNV10437.1 ATP-binding protein [Tardiphaga sp. 709]
MVTRKTELEEIDGTPEKRLFLSIISDYDLKTGLCELVDNAIDFWISNDKSTSLEVEIILDFNRQIISIRDNAGGVKEQDLRLLIAPGATGNKSHEEVIGTFGVGGKRAGVALGELVEIRTRYKREKSLEIDLTNEWLQSDDWALAAYEIPNVAPGTTSVEISKLRQSFDEEDIDIVREHLSETYDWFIRDGCKITLNGEGLSPIRFDVWAYPPGFEPKEAVFTITPRAEQSLKVTMTAGLIRDRVPEKDNYGVYVYCNHRLIVKELRTRDVGYFVSGEAGVPHPDASLCRVIVHVQGAPDVMPWNSSKSGLNFNHAAFSQLRPTLIGLVSYFSSLSRRTKNNWDNAVYPHARGRVQTIEPSEISIGRKITLPKLPRTRKPARIDALRSKNKAVLRQKPWTLGLIEAMGLVDLISKQKLDTKNRVALILLDSNFEIALKEFIVNRTDIFPPHVYNDAKIVQLFKARHSVINDVKQHVNLTPALLAKVQHYYNLRNKLVHERATVGITDAQVLDYRKTVEKVLRLLFNLKFPSD